MQINSFIGRAASSPTVTGAGDNAVAKFVLISNEYAGKDKDSGESKERAVSLRFTAFGKMGETLAKNVMKGDQLIVDYRIENNNWTDKDQQEQYGYNFVVKGFEFGAPGEAKRAQLAGNVSHAKPAPQEKGGKGSRAKG